MNSRQCVIRWRAPALLLCMAFAHAVVASEDPPVEPSPAELALPDESTAGSDKLLLSAGVSEIEGAAGGGLTPWAIIGGYGTRDQIGANAFYSRLTVQDYQLDGIGALVGLLDRLELSIAQQRFDVEGDSEAFGLGQNSTFKQTIVGLKVKVAGDALLDQDRWLPQISVGVQFKKNDRNAVLEAIGAKDNEGTDFYLSATKFYLSQSLLANLTLRFTKANQIGLLGFGGERNNDYQAQLEGSLAWLLSRSVVIGAEYRMKPDNLGIATENDWCDLFVAWAPNKRISLTLAYADLGNILVSGNQSGPYASLQIGF